MAEYEKKIDKIRKYFDVNRGKVYPIKNEILLKKDEYHKSLYLRMLCMLAQYTGTPTEDQVLYIGRLMIGIGAENKLEDYMRMALEIEEKDVDSFISICAGNDLAYYFCIDGIIIFNFSNSNEKDYKLLAEIIEALRITKSEIKHLSAVTKAILEQKSELFDKAKPLSTSKTQTFNFLPYIESFYVGAIIDTKDEKHYYSSNKAEFGLGSQNIIFTEKTVVFENLILSISAEWKFEGCEEVKFINCNLIGNDKPLTFKGTRKVNFENCDIRNFTKRVAELSSVDYIEISHNHITNCGYADPKSYEPYISVGVFLVHCVSGNTLVPNEKISICDNYISNCYIKGRSGNYIFMQFQIPPKEIICCNNKFFNCIELTERRGGSCLIGSSLRRFYKSDMDRYNISNNTCSGCGELFSVSN